MGAALLAMILLQAADPGRPASPSAAVFARAEPGRAWDLSRDHRAHPEFALEWWYLTGHLVAEDGTKLGYQATFFRSALTPAVPERRSPLAARDVLMWHGAVTDISAGTFSHDEILARGSAGWAGASPERLDVSVHGNALREVDGTRWQLRADSAGWRLELDFALEGPVMLHGVEPGLSLKGPGAGQASHYVSRPRLPTTGWMVRPDGRRLRVEGLSWFDQEFGSGQLAESQVGWDWFAANLSDGSSLMIYLLREKDGTLSPTSSGTFTPAAAPSQHLTLADLSVTTVARWTSPRSGGIYPSAWRIEVPRLGIRIEARAQVADQERGSGVGGTAGPVYWEGACEFTGTRDGIALTGTGYAELVGHAGPLRLLR